MTGEALDGSLLNGIVWCRQVDNEAESPRYTPYPDAFPGLTESLPRIRFVGDLAINASDTSDYWDPDPLRRFSYYNNLFLFPSRGGKQLCLGRMFLSTEERPRLGIKTLVMDTHALFSGRNAVRTLREWHQAMDTPLSKPTPPYRQPGLAGSFSQGLTYDDTETDAPILVLLSYGWGSAVDTLFDLLERVPETLVALSGILVFPYFIPAAKVDSAELAKSFPLTLAAFRVPSRATPDQRHRWIEGWSKRDLTVVDLTSAPTQPPAQSSTMVDAWTNDHGEKQWNLLRSAVDTTELSKVLSDHFPAEEGPYRRKELARLSGIMEAAAGAEKKRSKSPKKMPPSPAPRPSAAVESPPPLVSVPPPWLEATRHVRVDRVGFAVPQPSRPTPSPVVPTPVPTHESRAEPFSLPESRIRKEDIEALVATRVSEEMAHYFTGEHGLIADRFTQVDALRIQLNDLDDRLRTFVDRTIPVIRKTLTKVGEMKHVSPRGALQRGQDIAEIKEELWQELRRMEAEFTRKSGEVLERMEETLQTQGRIWLTLVREVERMSEERQTRSPERRDSRR